MEHIEEMVHGKFKFSLKDLLELSKCDDNIPLPNDFRIEYFEEKERDYRPILFVISSATLPTSKEIIVNKIEKFLVNVIEKSGYEKENTMITIYSDDFHDDNNIYVGLEWLFQKIA